MRAGAYLVVPLVGPTNLNSTAVLGALWVGELYVLSMASNVLVAADVVIDTAVGAAMLRHSVDPMNAGGADPYKVQRSQYSQYIATACTSTEVGVPSRGLARRNSARSEGGKLGNRPSRHVPLYSSS